MNKEVRVRFAPSPTGPLHIGGVRTALYNYLFAKKNNGIFLLRIEDTDQTRYVEGAEQYIIDSLKWAGIEYTEGVGAGGDHGPYRQSERKAMYRQYALQLINSGNAYYAFDTPEELDQMRENMKKQGVPSPQYNMVMRQYMKNSLTLPEDEVKQKIENGEPYVIRIKMPRGEEVKVNDIIRGWVTFQTNQLDDKVLFKSDGMPTYHLANVVDDHLMQISHVIRGEEWLPSTPTHVLLYKYLGWGEDQPAFAHLPLILKPDGPGKLSKRDGDRLGFPVFPMQWTDPKTGEFSRGYKEDGFFSEPFINMLAFLGWNPGTEQEIFTQEELVEAFSLDRVGKSGAKFDYNKGCWYNQQYLKSMENNKLKEYFKPLLHERGIACSDSFLETASGLIKERLTFINDFWEVGNYFFQKPKAYDEKTIRKKWKSASKSSFEELLSKLEASDFSSSSIESIVKQFIEDKEMKFGDVLPPLRIMISGQSSGPSLFDILSLLGKEEVISRMQTAMNLFEIIQQEKTA